ncbi:CCA tRNA nucleotidyltransferase [Candidatus Bathyarchaeota archaeon]|nr:CCA tRNA nucleotidyltransferase [Candidatus Bathyarchaeota archaeon]
MNSSIPKISEKVLRRIVPGKRERERVYALSEELVQRVSRAARTASLKAEVSVQGSVAKDTWLSGEADIDIFLRVDAGLSRAQLETTCLAVAKEAIRGYRAIERFAEHPYIEAFIGSSRVNIVPCYNVKKGMWKSATDRTPYHTEYVKEHLDAALRNEVRLLKRFMKGIGTYGAEIRIGGFSGMLCEILILYYRSFQKTLQAASRWREGTIIDLENLLGGDYEDAYDLFDRSLIVIDPVDKARNVAAAVRDEKLWEFVAFSRAFLSAPSLKFFFPPKRKWMSRNEFLRKLDGRETSLVGLAFGRIDAPVDVVWGQIFKTEKSIARFLQTRGFEVMRSSSFSNEGDLNLVIIELQNEILPKSMKRIGPPVERASESSRFLEAHLRAKDTLSGPWIEKDRWVVLKARRQLRVSEILREALRDGGQSIGVPSLVAEAVRKKRFSLLTGRQLSRLLKSGEFSEFISAYLRGEPRWLRWRPVDFPQLESDSFEPSKHP